MEDKGRGVIATRPIKKGESLFPFEGRLVSKDRVRNFNAALQIDQDLFLESEGTLDEYVNHSCRPNCTIEFKRWELVASKNIEEGEELTFNYNTTEYDLRDQGCHFWCSCGSSDCVGKVQGFRYLSLDCKLSLLSSLSPFLRAKVTKKIRGLAPFQLGLDTN